MNADEIYRLIDGMVESAQKIKALVSAGQVRVVRAGESLQAALDAGGTIEFEGVHEGNFFARIPDTTLIGRPGAGLAGPSTQPALYVPIGSRRVRFASFFARSASTQAVVRVGANDANQTKLEQEPADVQLTDIIVPGHRGKRAFEVNARGVRMERCQGIDVWESIAGSDSCALGMINSSGDLTVIGGRYEGGSECFLSGGDTNKMGVAPRNLLFEDALFVKPIAWKDDGIRRNAKNLFELKNAEDVLVRRCYFAGSYADAQAGWAVVLTPTRDGRVARIRFEDCTFERVGGIAQIVGRAAGYYTPVRNSVEFVRCSFHVDHRLMGGTGVLAQIEGEPEYVHFEDCTWQLTGNKILSYGFNKVMEADGSTRRGGQLGRLRMVRCKGNAPNAGSSTSYGIMLDGFKAGSTTDTTAYANGGANQEGFVSVGELDVRDNTFSGAVSSVMKRNFPNNTYL